MFYDKDHDFHKYSIKKFDKKSSTDSKFDSLIDLYRKFISLKDLVPREKKEDKKVEVLNVAFNLYEKLIEEYKKNYESEPRDDKTYVWEQKYNPRKLKDLDYEPVKLKTESLSGEDKSGIKQPTQLKQLDLNKISKPSRIGVPRKDFNSLIKDVVENSDNKNYKTKVTNNSFDLKNTEEFLVKIITKKISKKEALKLYNNSIEPDVNVLSNVPGKSKSKRINILNVLNNIKWSLFEGFYLHYKDAPLRNNI